MSITGAADEHRDCPYFGLDYYDEKWARWFFGRDTETDQVITNLRASRLTLVHADSGVGKSSLLRAGVAARLTELANQSRNRGRHARFLPVVFSRWQSDPLPDLIDKIERVARDLTPDGVVDPLPRDSLSNALSAAAKATNSTLLVILDQFEEYLLYSSKEQPPQQLADELARAVNDVDLPANFVIAIREDAYAGLGELFKGRIANIYGNFLDIAYLTQEEAAEAIRRPLLEVYNRQPGVEPVTIEDALVAAVIRQVPAQGSGPNGGDGQSTGNGDGLVAAPLLQLVMDRVWKREREKHSNMLRLTTLEELEGVERIVDTHLAEALAELGPQGREVAVDAFEYLVTPSGGKIAESIPDLASRTTHTEDELAGVLEALDQARILRPVAPPPGRSRRYRRYEIFHDVLGPAINRVIESRHTERLEREQSRAQRFRMVAIVACSLLVLAIAAIVWALSERSSAIHQSAAANSRRLAASAETVAPQNPELATLLSLQALRLSPTQEARTALRQALPQLQVAATLDPSVPQRAVGFSRDGSRLITVGADGIIRIFDGHSYREMKSFAVPGGLTAAVVSPDGTRVATSYEDGTARIWSAQTGRQLAAVTAPDGYGLSAVSFSPDGGRILTTGGDDQIRIWDSRTGRLLLTAAEHHRPGAPHVLLAATFSPNGKQVLATSADGNALVWGAATGALVATLRGQVGLLGAAFSHDGTRIVTASGDGDARVWSATTGRQLETFSVPSMPDGYPPFMWTASFSPGDSRIVSGSSDGTTRIWNASDPKSVRVLTHDSRGAILQAAYSPNGGQIAIGDAGGTVTVWNARTGHLSSTLPPPARSPAPLTDAIFTSGGRDAVLASRFGSLTFWRREGLNAPAGRPTWVQVTAVAIPEGDAITSLAVGMHGKMLATGAASGRIWLWALPSGQPEGEPFAGGQTINTIAFDPVEPHVILAASDDGCVYLVNVNTGLAASRHNICTTDGYGVTAAAFSRDGKHIVTGDASGAVQLWNAATQKPVGGSFYDGNLRINSIEFSPNGRDVVFGSGSYGWIYQAAPPHTEIGGVGVPTSVVHDAVFSPDGTTIATASTDGLGRIWDAASDDLLLPLAGHSGPVESASFSPDGQQLITASADGTAKVWDTAPVEQSELLPGSRYLITAAVDPRQPQLVATAGGSQQAYFVSVWNRDDPLRPVATLGIPSGPGGNTSAEFSHDGRYLVATGGNEQAEIYAVSTILSAGDRARPVAVLNASGTGSTCSSHRASGMLVAGFMSAEFSQNGQFVVTADDDGSACVWSVRTHQPLRLIPEPPGASGGVSNSTEGAAPVNWAVFDPTGNLVLTASDDGTARIWNWRGGTQLKTLPEPSGAAIHDAFFSPNGKLVVTATDAGVAGIWRVASGEEIRQLAVPDRAQIFNAAFSPDGRWLVACGDGTSIFDASNGRRLTDLPYGSAVSDCEFSPGGGYVVTAGQSGATRIFSTQMAGSLGQLETIARARVTTSLTAAQRRQYAVP